MSKSHRGNFGILSNFDHFVPRISDIIIVCLWLLIGAFIANIIALIPVFLLKSREINAGIDVVMLIVYPLMFIPAMIFASTQSRKNESFVKGCKLNNFHFAPLGGVLCVLFAILATLSLNFIADFFINLLPPMPESLKAALNGITQGNFVLNFISVAIFAPFFEEWLCRGIVLRGLLNYKNKKGHSIRPVWAIIISALFFAIIHANPWQAIAAFMLGCLFGYVYWKTGSLYLTMLMHAVNNFTALVLAHVPALKDVESWSSVMDSHTFILVFCECVLFTALAVFEFSKIKLKKKSGNFDEVPSLFD